MMAANLFDNWLFFLLVAVAMLFRWLMSTANKASKDSEEPDGSDRRSTSVPPPGPRAPVDSDTERIRKFLEALGQPPGSRPPLPVTPRQMDTERAAQEARHRLEQAKRASVEAKKKKFIPSGSLSPLTTIPPPLPVESASPPQVATEEGPSRSRDLLPTTYEVQETRLAGPAATVPATPGSTVNLATLLRSPSGLRNAIILREVFGPPRSMQPFELV